MYLAPIALIVILLLILSWSTISEHLFQKKHPDEPTAKDKSDINSDLETVEAEQIEFKTAFDKLAKLKKAGKPTDEVQTKFDEREVKVGLHLKKIDNLITAEEQKIGKESNKAEKELLKEKQIKAWRKELTNVQTQYQAILDDTKGTN